MKKRVFLRDLRDYDLRRDDSVVRQLEMQVDAAINEAGYRLQFWKDVALYGVDEAILYVRNGGYGNADAIAETWNRIKVRLTNHLGG